MANPPTFSVNWVKTDLATKAYLKSRVSNVVNGANEKETAIYRAAIYSLIDIGLDTRTANGFTFSARNVQLDTFSKSLEKRCDQAEGSAQQGFQIFDCNPSAVLDRLQLLSLVELTEDLINDSSTILLNIEPLLPVSDGVVKFPAEKEAEKEESPSDDGETSTREDEDEEEMGQDPPSYIHLNHTDAAPIPTEDPAFPSITFIVPSTSCRSEADVRKKVYELITWKMHNTPQKIAGTAAAQLILDLGFSFRNGTTDKHGDEDLPVIFTQRPVNMGSVFRRMKSKLASEEGSADWNLLSKKAQTKLKNNAAPKQQVKTYNSFKAVIRSLVDKGVIAIHGSAKSKRGKNSRHDVNADAYVKLRLNIGAMLPDATIIDAPLAISGDGGAGGGGSGGRGRERETLEPPKAKRVAVDNETCGFTNNTGNAAAADPYRIPVRLVGLGTPASAPAPSGTPNAAPQQQLLLLQQQPFRAATWSGPTIIENLRTANQAIDQIRLLLDGLCVIGTPSDLRYFPSSNIDLLSISGSTGTVWMFDFKRTSQPESREIWKSLKTEIFDKAISVYVHDCRWLGPALYRQGDIRLNNVLDVQVAHGVLEVVKGIGGKAGGVALPRNLPQIFAECGIPSNPKLDMGITPEFFRRRPLPRTVQEYVSHDTFHLYSVGRQLKSALGTEGTISVIRMSKAYSETHFKETQRSYNASLGGPAAAGGPTSDPRKLPHGVPLQVTFDDQNRLFIANYVVAPRDLSNITAAGTIMIGSTCEVPTNDDADDPTKSRDVSTVLSLFPSEIAEAILSLCSNTYGMDQSKDSDEEGEIVNGLTVTTSTRPAGGAAPQKPKMRWPIEILVDVGRPILIRFFDGSEEFLDASLKFSVDEALQMLMKTTPPTTTILATTTDISPYHGDRVHLSNIFSSDNRAGIPGTLHRISAIRGRKHEVLGLTYRLGRHLEGVGDLISDVLANVGHSTGNVSIHTGMESNDDHPGSSTAAGAATDPMLTNDKSGGVLLLGPPGVGKSTLLRDIARILADTFSKRVIVVDTSNEIAGEGSVPHACIGNARRMMVPHRDRQHEVMKEAVQNHNPDVVIIDEIADRYEVAAARTIAQRGVALIGTAHGTTLESLIKNPETNHLIGGIQTVIVGDQTALYSSSRSPGAAGMKKARTERKAAPCFTTVIELLGPSKWRIHRDVAKSVDFILDGKRAETELRWIAKNGRYMAQFEGGKLTPMDVHGSKAAQIAMRGSVAALAGVDGGEKVAWVADLALLASRYP